MNTLYEVSERAPEAPAARCCHSQLIPIFVQHQQKRLCCGLPTLQRLSSHPSVFTLNHKEKSVEICTPEQRNGTGRLVFVPHSTSPALGQ